MELVYIPSFSLTHKSQILKEATLRDHAGWSMNSKMPSVYLHYFGNESCNSILESYGIIKKENSQANRLMSLQCSGCGESNKPTSNFCIKCKMVLKYDEFIESLDNEKQLMSQQHEEEMKAMNERMDRTDRILKLDRA